jgi:hypothetical protein
MVRIEQAEVYMTFRKVQWYILISGSTEFSLKTLLTKILAAMSSSEDNISLKQRLLGLGELIRWQILEWKLRLLAFQAMFPFDHSAPRQLLHEFDILLVQPWNGPAQIGDAFVDDHVRMPVLSY